VNLVRFAMSAGDVLLGCSLGEGQHLQGLLDVGTRMSLGRSRGLDRRSAMRARCVPLVRERLSVLPFCTALHPAVSQGPTSLSGCSDAADYRFHATRCIEAAVSAGVRSAGPEGRDRTNLSGIARMANSA
jgi:hypothetical protein